MNNLKKLRINREIKSLEVAKYLNIRPSTYSEMEANIENARGPTLIKIAEFFNVSVDYILGLIEEPTPLDRKIDTPPPQKEENAIKLRPTDKEALETTAKIINEILKK